jgi:hypothetical protein
MNYLVGKNNPLTLLAIKMEQKMKKLFTLSTLALGIAFLTASAELPTQGARIVPSGKKVYRSGILHNPNFTSQAAASIDTNSRWYNYGETMDLHRGGTSVLNTNYLFPDSNIIAEFGPSTAPEYGSPFVHSQGVVFDLSSSKFYDPTYYSPDSNMQYSASQAYKLDSIRYLFLYEKNIPGVTDTLIFEVVINPSTTQLPTYFFTGMMNNFNFDTVRFKALTYSFQRNGLNQTFPPANQARKIYKVALTDAVIADTLAGGLNYVQFPCIGLNNMNAGSRYVMTSVKFKPGYTWLSNVDTLNRKNILNFLSYEETDGGFPTYTPDDYNSSQIAITDVRYNLDPNWNGFYIPSVAYTAPFSFEHHLVYYKIRKAGTCASPITASVDTVINTNCSQPNGSFTVVATGGSTGNYTYLFNGNINNTGTFNNVGPGTYTVTVSDGQNCQTNLQNVVVSNSGTPATLTSTSVPTTQCNSADGQATVNATGGAPFTYLWSNGDTTSSISAGPGVYTVTVTNTFGCSSTRTIGIIPGGIPSITSAVSNVPCNGQSNGSASVTYNGTATPSYQWYVGPGVGSQLPSQTNDTLSGRAAGSYTCIISDSNQCKDTIEVSITQPLAITGSVSSTPQFSVNPPDGTATITANGGTPPYSFLWSNGQSSTNNPSTISDLANGTYNVIISDANGCTLTRTFAVLLSGISSLNTDAYSTKLYPNPTSNTVTVEFNAENNENLNVRMLNLNGQDVLEPTRIPSKGKNIITLDVSSLPRGAYFMQITGDSGTASRKLIKL